MPSDTKTLRESIPLATKKVLKKTITSVGGSVIMLIFFAVLLMMPLLSTALNFLEYIIMGVFAAIVIVIVSAYIYQMAYYNSYLYDSKNGFLTIKKGVIIPKETTLPLEKINDIYIDQDIFDKIFGLYDVHFSISTVESGLDPHIDGLNKDNSHKLREIMLKGIKDTNTSRKR